MPWITNIHLDVFVFLCSIVDNRTNDSTVHLDLVPVLGTFRTLVDLNRSPFTTWYILGSIIAVVASIVDRRADVEGIPGGSSIRPMEPHSRYSVTVTAAIAVSSSKMDDVRPSALELRWVDLEANGNSVLLIEMKELTLDCLSAS